tara:strand:- start:228 stop:443 length:216 start_codon:yes stop_codon:yes gene_type:complete
MTPKEKARDLFNSYWYCLLESNMSNRDFFTKMCSIIAIDEMLLNDGWSGSVQEWELFKNYFEEVKEEIQKL